MKNRRSLGRTCSNCPTAIYDTSKTGMCKPCFLRSRNSDPSFRKIVSETLRRRCREDPAYYRRMAETMRTNRRNALENPEIRARQRAQARENAKILHTPEVKAKRLANLRACGGHKRLRWIPAKHRDEYKRLVRNGYGADRAAARIRAIIAAERAQLTPHERALQAIAEGRATVCIMPRASNDPAYTLGGVSSGWAA